MGSPVVAGQRVPLFDMQGLHASLAGSLKAAVNAVIDDGAFCGGPHVQRFEAEFAEFVGARYAVGVQSGTAALMAALHAAGVGPGDQVIAPTNTFVATVGAIQAVGATPVLCDVDPHTLLMTHATAVAHVRPQTKAIVPVHLYGQLAELNGLRALAREHMLVLVEDAAQAHGATDGARIAGTFGSAGCFSFYPGKNLGALGEAGALVTDSSELAEAARKYRNHGGTVRYEHDTFGLNFRMAGFQGAALSVKLKLLESWNARRREVAARYRNAFAELPGLRCVALGETARREPRAHVYHQFVVRVSAREEFRSRLSERGIDTGIHYPTPVHLMPAYRHLKQPEGRLPNAEQAAKEVVSLPMFPTLSDAQVERVVEAVSAVAKELDGGE